MQPFVLRGAPAAPAGYSRRTPSIHYTSGSGDFNQAPKAVKPRTQWLLLISPSSKLAASTGLDSSQGVLFPLKPSLQAQLVAAAREFALQQVVGLSLLLNLGEGLAYAKLTDDSWTSTWAQLPAGDSWSSISPGAGVMPRVSLPIAASILLDFSTVPHVSDVHQLPETKLDAHTDLGHRQKPSKPLFLRSSLPQLVASPEPLVLPFPGQPSPQKDQDTTSSVEKALSLDKAASQVTEDSDENRTASWPLTPASPERLPSASLMDRLIDSASPSRPYFSNTESPWSKMNVSRDMGPLIEVSRDTVVRPLAQCSEPSPLVPSLTASAKLPLVRTKLQPAYPYNLSQIYEPIWPYITVYPTMQLDQPPRSSVKVPRQLDSPCSGRHSAASRPSIRTKLLPSYPYNLSQIYEAVWPYLTIYPSVAATQSSPLQSCNRSSSRLASKSLEVSRHAITARNKDHRLAYPFNLSAIYPAIYPHFDLYPSIQGVTLDKTHIRTPSCQKQLVYTTQTYEVDIKRPLEHERSTKPRASRSSSLSNEVELIIKRSSPSKTAFFEQGEAVQAMNFRRRKIPIPISPMPQVVPLMLANNDNSMRRASDSSTNTRSPFHLASPMLGHFDFSPSSPVFVA